LRIRSSSKEGNTVERSQVETNASRKKRDRPATTKKSDINRIDEPNMCYGDTDTVSSNSSVVDPVRNPINNSSSKTIDLEISAIKTDTLPKSLKEFKIPGTGTPAKNHKFYPTKGVVKKRYARPGLKKLRKLKDMAKNAATPPKNIKK
jgi:hypothetical protein